MWTPRLKSSALYVRRLIAHGWSADEVARLYGIAPGDVGWILSHPPRKPVERGQARMIRGRLGPVVRGRIVAGIPPDAIARELDLTEAAICDYILRLTPRQRHKRRVGPLLNRARSAREQAALSEWVRFQAEAAGATLPVPPAPPMGPAPAIEPESWEGPIDPCSQRFPGRHRPKPKRKRRGSPRKETDGRVRLKRADRAEARRLAREEGWGYQRIARRLGVAASTIWELLRGKSHGGDGAESVPSLPTCTPIGMQPVTNPEGPKRKRIPKMTQRTLAPELRAEARRLAAEGLGARTIAKRLGVSFTVIRNLLRGKTYFDDADAPRARPGPARWEEPADDRQKWVNAKLSYEDAVRVRELRAEGVSRAELAAHFGVSYSVIGQILRGETYTAPPPDTPALPRRRGADPPPA